jgi:hypothetical protein
MTIYIACSFTFLNSYLSLCIWLPVHEIRDSISVNDGNSWLTLRNLGMYATWLVTTRMGLHCIIVTVIYMAHNINSIFTCMTYYKWRGHLLFLDWALTVSCTIGHCAAMIWPCLRSGQLIRIFCLVLHLWFHCGEILLGVFVYDYVFGYIRD